MSNNIKYNSFNTSDDNTKKDLMQQTNAEKIALPIIDKTTHQSTQLIE